MKRAIVIILIMILVAGGGAGGLMMLGIVPNPFNPKMPERPLTAAVTAAADTAEEPPPWVLPAAPRRSRSFLRPSLRFRLRCALPEFRPIADSGLEPDKPIGGVRSVPKATHLQTDWRVT